MEWRRFQTALGIGQPRGRGQWLLLIALGMALLLTSCGGTLEKSRKASPDWSRGVKVGQYGVGSIGMVAEGAGELVHIVWPRKQAGDISIGYLQLNGNAEPVLTKDLDIPEGAPRAPRLKPAGEGIMHLFWASRPGGQRNWDLWHAFLDVQQATLSGAKKLSPEDSNVGQYVAISDADGGCYVAWAAEADGSLSFLHMNRNGDLAAGPTLLAAQGDNPAIQVDETGTLHAVWTADSALNYTSIPEGRVAPGEAVPIAQIVLGTGDTLSGLALGLSEGWVYALWSVSSQSGLSAGEAMSAFVAFPTGSPRMSIPERLWLWPSEEQDYQPYEGGLGIQSLADPAVSPYGSDWVEEPVTLEGISGSMAAAITVRQQFRLDSFVQIALLVFEQGRFRGYEVVSLSESISQSPSIAQDQAGYMHLAWREGSGSDRIYYATTAPAASEALNTITWGEIMGSLASGSAEALSGLAFFPIAFFWQVPGLIVMGILDLKRRQKSLRDPIVLSGLVVSLLIFNVMKLLLLPSIPTHVPFSAWIDLPESVEILLRIAVPLAILLVATLVAWWTKKKRELESNALFFLILASVDTVLTLTVYGVIILGA